MSEDIKDRIREAYAALMERKGLSPRWGQRQMIAEIANTLARIPAPGDSTPGDSTPGDSSADTLRSRAEPAVCVIEAGTGTGKTIAYSVTAIPMAQALNKRLVVATATVALQEQFVNKDLPDIRSDSGLDFSYALAKGRRRYVCLSKLDRLLASDEGASAVLPLYPDEFEPALARDAAPVYQAMLEALGRGEWDGDRDNWREALPDALWSTTTSDHSQCSGRRCPNIAQCSFYRAREDLAHADVIVANHDLVLADLALGGGAILPEPEDCIYIFDEGHHLPDKALSHFASFCRLHSTVAWLEESVKAIAQAAPVLAGLQGAKSGLGKLPAQLEEATRSLEQADQLLAVLFARMASGDGRDSERVRFAHGRVPEELIPVAANLAAQFKALGGTLGRLEQVLEDALEDDFSGLDQSDLETWHLSIGGMLGRAESTLALWQAFAVSGEGEQPPMARWMTLLEGAGQQGFELRCSPILAADLLQEYLWPRAAGVVITSATITALNSFERFILHSGVPQGARFKMVGSPFDYSRALFRVPAMSCDPSDPEGHTQALIAMLPQELDPDEASLVLFSSRRQMQEVFQGLEHIWRERILVQGDTSKQEILRQHRERVDAGRGSVIFGLASFAEGVDLPGSYCEHVLIAKIPFAVPDSPIEASLAEWIEARGGNAFMEISVPDAALRLVQACGRLIRSEQDSGRVTLLDRRLLTRRYGRAILDSLPPFQRQLA